MKTRNGHFIGLILCFTTELVASGPIVFEKNFSGDRCKDPIEDRNNGFSENSKVQSRLEPSEKSSRTFNDMFNLKRSPNLDESALQKRQVGVVYKEDKPIGILQPYQRTYRFIPVKEEGAEEEASNMPVGIAKREVSSSYPTILANFKIDSKLEKKRNDEVADDEVKELKSTIRQLRSAKSSNAEYFQEKLKNILDEMGLIEEDEGMSQKREISEKDLIRRDDTNFNFEPQHAKFCDENAPSGNNLFGVEERRSEMKSMNLPYTKRQSRKKRGKDQEEELAPTNKETLKMISEDVKPSQLRERNAQVDAETDNVAHIQKQLNNLKEEVIRDMRGAQKEDYEESDDLQRKKRQVPRTLIGEENDAVDPVKNSGLELKPLIRKRRSLDYDEGSAILNHRKKRTSKADPPCPHNDEIAEGGELLGGDEFEEHGGKRKRQILNEEEEYDELDDPERERRSYEYYDEDKLLDSRAKTRERRTITQDQGTESRSQQLSDLSDSDLFGALPKSYNGELSRYKRVK